MQALLNRNKCKTLSALRGTYNSAVAKTDAGVSALLAVNGIQPRAREFFVAQMVTLVTDARVRFRLVGVEQGPSTQELS